MQNEFSLLHRDSERAVLPECARKGYAFLPYFPLASGVLSGKYERGKPGPAGARLSTSGNSLTARFLNQKNLGQTEALRDFAAARGHSLIELAFSWLAAHAEVASVIAGATTVDQVKTNVRTVAWKLTPEDLGAIDAIVPAPAPLAP